jgi:hypothetical protein
MVRWWFERVSELAPPLRGSAIGMDQSRPEGRGLRPRRSVNLRHAGLVRANLRRARCVRSDLRGAALIETDLSAADFTRADLREANLRKADATGAVFHQADLRLADLRGTDLRQADLTSARLDEAMASELTRWPSGFDPAAAGVVSAHDPGPEPGPLLQVPGITHQAPPPRSLR